MAVSDCQFQDARVDQLEDVFRSDHLGHRLDLDGFLAFVLEFSIDIPKVGNVTASLPNVNGFPRQIIDRFDSLDLFVRHEELIHIGDIGIRERHQFFPLRRHGQASRRHVSLAVFHVNEEFGKVRGEENEFDLLGPFFDPFVEVSLVLSHEFVFEPVEPPLLDKKIGFAVRHENPDIAALLDGGEVSLEAFDRSFYENLAAVVFRGESLRGEAGSDGDENNEKGS